MIKYSEYRMVIEMLDKKLNQREYNDILKQMGVMNENGKVDLKNMTEKINTFLKSEENQKKFLKDIKKVDIGGKKVKIKAKKLNPGQTAIYLDQVMSRILSNPKFVKKVLNGKVKDRDILISSDNHIIDGHHRWCSAFILNPKCKIKCTKINLPIEIALPILNAILKESNSKNQEQTGEEKHNIFKLAYNKKLPIELNEITEKMAKKDTWKTGKDKKKMIGNLFEKLQKNDKDINPLLYLAKNIQKLPTPHGNLTGRKDMPQLKDDELKSIIKKY